VPVGGYVRCLCAALLFWRRLGARETCEASGCPHTFSSRPDLFGLLWGATWPISVLPPRGACPCTSWRRAGHLPCPISVCAKIWNFMQRTGISFLGRHFSFAILRFLRSRTAGRGRWGGDASLELPPPIQHRPHPHSGIACFRGGYFMTRLYCSSCSGLSARGTSIMDHYHDSPSPPLLLPIPWIISTSRCSRH
jgi:hypothetical protein